MRNKLIRQKVNYFTTMISSRNSISSDHKSLLSSNDGTDRAKVENLDQAIAEIERLRKDGEKLQGELSGKPLEPLKHLDLQDVTHYDLLYFNFSKQQEPREIVSKD